MILYHAQGLKPYFVITSIKNLMAITATINATIFPIIKYIKLLPLNSNSNPFISTPFSFQSFKKTEYVVTANIVGTAKKNENSAAAFLLSFCCIPPMMDAALLLVPGIMAKHCQKPIIMADLNEISFSV